MAQLKDNTGGNYYPTTTTGNVIAGENKTLEQRLQEIEQGGGGGSLSDEWNDAQLTMASEGHVLNTCSKGARIDINNTVDTKYNIYVSDVVEYETIKVVASSILNRAHFVFADKQGFAAADSQAATGNSYRTAPVTYEVTAPKGAVKIFICENKDVNGVGSTKMYRKQLAGEAMAAYKDKMANRMRITDAELQKYYDLGGQKMDTYNLVEEKVGIIVIGQSNADGRIPSADFPATANINGVDITLAKSIPTCKFLKGRNKENGTTGSHNYDYSESQFAAYNNTGVWAFDQVLYNAIANALGENEFYVCKQTDGDTAIQGVDFVYPQSFWPDVDRFKFDTRSFSELYHLKNVVERALELQPNLKIKAIVMHQGEGDKPRSLMEGSYYIGLCRMIQWIRGLVGSPNLPFIFGSIPTNSYSYSEIIYNDMMRCAADMQNVYLVTMGEASGWVHDTMYDNGMPVHFSSADAVKLADDMYKLMVSRKMLAPYV